MTTKYKLKVIQTRGKLWGWGWLLDRLFINDWPEVIQSQVVRTRFKMDEYLNEVEVLKAKIDELLREEEE